MDTKKLRQKILDLAIHGKLVPQDPNDEPASVLLERIRAEKERLIAEGKIKRSKKSSTSDTPHYENVPFEVPEGWCWCTLDELTTSIGDGLHGTPKFDDNGEYYFVNGNNLDGIISIKKETKRTTIDEYIKQGLRFNSQTIFVSINGTLGNIAFYNNDPIVLGKSACYINLLDGISKEYIAVILRCQYFLNYCRDTATGSTIKNVPLAAMRALFIPIPSYQEQLRIVDEVEKILEYVDSLDENTQDLESSIIKAKSKILDLAIHGKLVPQDANDEPASELLKHINPKAIASCDNPHYEQVPFEIPDNWVWVRIDEINKFKSKTVNPQNYPTDQFELYSVPTFETGEPEFPYGKDIASSKVEVEEGDVLLCKINPHLNRVWVVRRRIRQLKSLASSEWIVIRTDEIMPEYLALTMQSPYFRELMMSNVSGVGGSLMRAQPTFVKQYMIPIPPIREQERIIEKVAQFNLYIDTIASTLP